MEINNQPFYGICFLQEDKGRDTEIVLPIVYAAEHFLNCKIDFELKWNAHLIYLNKPDFVIIPANCQGSKMYHDITKYCVSQNIKVFSFISEGNFNEKSGYDYYGFNVDRYFYQDYICSWSKRIQKYMQNGSPKEKDKIVLTGAPGFDRFKIYDFGNKKEFLKKYNKEKYHKIISYSGWAFGKIQYPQGREELEANVSVKTEGGTVKWVSEQRPIVRDMLKTAIEAYPDVLFVLKQHPSEYYPGLNIEQQNEMTELLEYPNVLYLQGQSEGIHDVISIADIVLGFETTSAIETWLMGDTPTIFLNKEVDFPRVDVYKGCLIAQKGNDLVGYIEEFYKGGSIKDFLDPKLKEQRELIIENTIGYDDGLNHLRHLNYLNKTLLKIDKNQINYKKSSYFSKLYMFFKVMRPLYKAKVVSNWAWFSKFNWVFERYKLSNIKVLQERYKPFMESFYQTKQIDKEFLKSFWSK